jgi:hypothetical protein
LPYNLFLIPIIAGYFILVSSSLLKYNSQRLTRSRILFESILIGVITIGIGFLIRTSVEICFPKIVPYFLEKLKIIPFEKSDYFWTFFFSCLLAILFFIILEICILYFYSKNDSVVWAVKKNGDELETLLKDSALNGQTVQLTLANHKVYIGFCEETPIPQKTNYISISPILSGYRDPKTKKLTITTDYFAVVEEFINEIEKQDGVELEKITLNTDVVIKQDEIITAGIYEQEIFDKFNKKGKRK